MFTVGSEKLVFYVRLALNLVKFSLFLENFYLGFSGVLLGGLLGGLIVYYFQLNPIGFSGYEEQFKQYGLAATAMPAFFSIPLIVRDMFAMLLLALSSTLYPILKIVRLLPLEAIRHV